MLSKFLIIQNSVKAIWEGQNDDYQEETKDRFVVNLVFCNGCDVLLRLGVLENNKTCVFR